MVSGVGHAVGLEDFLDVPQPGLGSRRPPAVLAVLPPAAARAAPPPLAHVQLARAEQIGWKERQER